MKKIKYDTFSAGQRIARARKSKGYTQRQLAEIIGMHENNLSGVERGVRGMSLDYLIALSKVLEVEVDYILFGERNIKLDSPMQKLLSKLDSEQREYIEKVLELSVDFVQSKKEKPKDD